MKIVTLSKHKGGFDKQPQKTLPAGADMPYRDDTPEPASHDGSVGWGFDHSESFRG